MRTTFILASCLILWPANARPDDKADAADWKALEGAWFVVGFDLGGQPFPDLAPKQLVFKDKTLAGLDPTLALPVKLDAGKSPKTMDLTDKRADPMTIPLIYEVTADKLRLVMPLPEDKKAALPRATSFDTKGKMFITITAKKVVK